MVKPACRIPARCKRPDMNSELFRSEGLQNEVCVAQVETLEAFESAGLYRDRSRVAGKGRKLQRDIIDGKVRAELSLGFGVFEGTPEDAGHLNAEALQGLAARRSEQVGVLAQAGNQAPRPARCSGWILPPVAVLAVGNHGIELVGEGAIGHPDSGKGRQGSFDVVGQHLFDQHLLVAEMIVDVGAGDIETLCNVAEVQPAVALLDQQLEGQCLDRITCARIVHEKPYSRAAALTSMSDFALSVDSKLTYM